MAETSYIISEGAPGNAGRDGRLKIRTPSSKAGAKGKTGKTGRAGRQGVAGRNGKAANTFSGSRNGIDGLQGKQGKQGRTGISPPGPQIYTLSNHVTYPDPVDATKKLVKAYTGGDNTFDQIIPAPSPSTTIQTSGIYAYNIQTSNGFESGFKIDGVNDQSSRSTAAMTVVYSDPVLIGLFFNPVVIIQIPGVTITSGSVNIVTLLTTSAKITFSAGGNSYTVYFNPSILSISLTTTIQNITYNTDGSVTVTYSIVLLSTAGLKTATINYASENRDMSGIISLNSGQVVQLYALGPVTVNRSSLALVSSA